MLIQVSLSRLKRLSGWSAVESFPLSPAPFQSLTLVSLSFIFFRIMNASRPSIVTFAAILIGSNLRIAVLNLFCSLKKRFQNLVIGNITRESVKRALANGITAEQVSIDKPLAVKSIILLFCSLTFHSSLLTL